MDRTAGILGVLAGLGVGVAAHAITWPTPEPPLASTEAPITPTQWIRSSCPSPTEAPEDPDLEALFEANRERDALTQNLADFIGVPQDFPEDLAAPYTPDTIEAWVETGIADIDGTWLDYIDCSEFPCMAVIRHPSLERDSAATAALFDRWGGRGVAVGDAFIVPLHPEDRVGDPLRTRYRRDVTMAEQSERWQEQNR